MFVPCFTFRRSLWAWFSSLTIVALSCRWLLAVGPWHARLKRSIFISTTTSFVTNFGTQRNLNGCTTSFGYDLTSFDFVAQWALWLILKITTWAIFTFQTSEGTSKLARRARNAWHRSSAISVRSLGALLRWTIDSCASKASLTSWLCSVDCEKSWWNFVASGWSFPFVEISFRTLEAWKTWVRILILEEAGWALGTCLAIGRIEFSLITVGSGWNGSARERRGKKGKETKC